jgi:hypothetical protein
MTNLLLLTGGQGSGKRLLKRMLNVHSQISVPPGDPNPYKRLFQALRNAVIPGVDVSSNFDNYFFDPDKLIQMNRICNVDLSRLEFRADGNEAVMGQLVHAEDGESMKTLFDRAVPQGSTKYSSFNQNDIVEFIPTLARAYPEAKFIIQIRDPRAVVNAGYGLHQETFVGYRLLDIIRQWRKTVAFSVHLKRTLSDQVCVITYENLVNESELSMQTVCEFLDMEYEPGMIDASQFTALDSFDSDSSWGLQGDILESRISAWKESENLSSNTVSLIEFMCGPEMQALGYASTKLETDWSHIVPFFHDDHQTLANEVLRSTLASSDVVDEKLIREHFLLSEVKTYLKEV